MRRVVSVWFPHWPTDRLQRRLARQPPDTAGPAPGDQGLVTAHHDGRRRVIAAVDRPAAALGLRPGMPMAQALALVPDLQIMEAEPDADAEILRRVALWCSRYTPLVAPCPPDGLWLDITGCAHLFEGEPALLAHLLTRLAQDGLPARAAIADTPGAAHALARHGSKPSVIVPPGAQGQAMASLPVAALRLAPELEATLRRLGFDQVGHLARIPRPLLARRFGPLPGLRIDQAHGRAREPIVPLLPEPALQHRVTFVEPLLTAEALQTATTHLVASLCQQLERTGLGARQLDLLFERVDNQLAAIRVGTVRPVRDPAHLVRLLVERLDTVDPGLGIEAMRLVVPLAEPLNWEQAAADRHAGLSDVAKLVDQLANRLGAERVYRATPVQSDIPERAVGRQAALTPAVMEHIAHPGTLPGPDQPGLVESDAPTPTPAQPTAHQAANSPRTQGVENQADMRSFQPTEECTPPYEHPARARVTRPVDAATALPVDRHLRLVASHTRSAGVSQTRTVIMATHAHPSGPPTLVCPSTATTQAGAGSTLEADPPLLRWKPKYEPNLEIDGHRTAWPHHRMVPSRIFSPPRPINALAALPDQPPIAFTWRRLRRRVRRADGPERIYGEWWAKDDEQKAVRDYYRVEDETGQRFWLYREGNGVDPDTGDLAWYLHGLF